MAKGADPIPETAAMSAAHITGQTGFGRSFRIRRHSAHPVASRVKSRRKVSARALRDLLNLGSSRLEEQKMDERIYKILEKLQMQHVPSADEGIHSPGFPMFSSNTIQNLTINAQPPVTIGQYTQMTNNDRSTTPPLHHPHRLHPSHSNTQKSERSHHSANTANTSQCKSRQRNYLLELIRNEILPYMKADGQSSGSQQ